MAGRICQPIHGFLLAVYFRDFGDFHHLHCLLIYAPLVFVSVAVLLVLGILIIRRLTSRRLEAYGDLSRKLGPRSTSLINNAVRGFLEVITFRAVEGVKKEYMDSTRMLFRIGSNSAVLSTIPAKLYEVLAVFA